MTCEAATRGAGGFEGHAEALARVLEPAVDVTQIGPGLAPELEQRHQVGHGPEFADDREGPLDGLQGLRRVPRQAMGRGGSRVSRCKFRAGGVGLQDLHRPLDQLELPGGIPSDPGNPGQPGERLPFAESVPRGSGGLQRFLTRGLRMCVPPDSPGRLPDA